MAIITRALAVAVALTSAPAASAQRGEQVGGLQVKRLPTGDDGAFSCSLGFVIMHPGSGGRPFRAIGASITALMVETDVPGLMVKIAYSDDSRMLRPPDSLVLVNPDGATNAADLIGKRPGDDEGYTLFDFHYREQGQRAFEGLAKDGLARLRVRVPGGAQEDWGLDLSSDPGVRGEWVACLKEQGFPISG